VYFVFAEPAPLRQIPFESLGDEVTRCAALLLRSRPNGGKQVRRNESIRPSFRIHLFTLSIAARTVKGSDVLNQLDASAIAWLGDGISPIHRVSVSIEAAISPGARETAC
jgi:hypothetical protein